MSDEPEHKAARHYKASHTPLAKQLRKQSTDAEKLLWNRLRNRQLAGAKFRRQQPVGKFIADFFCPELKLIIELDGGQHNIDANIKQDLLRDAYMLAEGYRVLRFWNNDVMQNIEGVLTAILGEVESPLPLGRGRGAGSLFSVPTPHLINTPHPSPLPQGERGLNRLVIASHNEGKVREIGELLAPLGLEVVSAGSLGLPEPEETESTFEGNAELKARAACTASGLPALADDSGLVIPALGGAPGIYSARWAPNKDFSVAFERIKRELIEAGAPLDSPAYFVCALSLALPPSAVETPLPLGEGKGAGLLPHVSIDGTPHNSISTPHPNPLPHLARRSACAQAAGERELECHTFIGRIDGRLCFPPRGQKGFGYDPIFIAEGYTHTFAEIDPQEKHAISHRARAFKGLMDYLLTLEVGGD